MFNSQMKKDIEKLLDCIRYIREGQKDDAAILHKRVDRLREEFAALLDYLGLEVKTIEPGLRIMEKGK